MSERICQSTDGFNVIFVHSSIDDMGLSAAEFRVYAHLSRRASSGMAWCGQESMASICHLHVDTVRSCIEALTARKLIRFVLRPGKSSIYHLTPPSDWLTDPPETKVTPPSDPPETKVTTPPKPRGAPPRNEGDEGNPIKGIQEGNPSVRAKPPRGQKPTIDDCISYGATIALPSIEAEKFYDYYESNGWRVGRNPMRDWKASMRNWKRSVGMNGSPRSASPPAWQRRKDIEEQITVLEGDLHYDHDKRANPDKVAKLRALNQELATLKAV